jgi:hypothetical protein
MARLNARNPQASQANPQAAMIQKYMPLIFGFIYLNVAAILNVYFIFSSAIRILTQEILFRKGIVAGPAAAPPATGAKKGPVVDRTERALPKAKNAGTGQAKSAAGANGANGKGRADPAKASPTRSGQAKQTGQAKQNGSTNGSNGRKGTSPGNRTGAGSAQKGPKNSTNGNNGSEAAGEDEESATQPKEHPRSKAKRERKAR